MSKIQIDKTSEELFQEAKRMEEQLRKIRIKMAEDQAKNPFSKKRKKIWKSSRGISSRKKTKSIKPRNIKSSRERNERRKKLVNLKSKSQSRLQPVDLEKEKDLYSHHFQVAFKLETKDKDEKINSARKYRGGSSRGKKLNFEMIRQKEVEKQRTDNLKKQKRRDLLKKNRTLLSSKEKNLIQKNLQTTYEVDDLIPQEFEIDTIEGVIHKRKIEEEQTKIGSLLNETFSEWKNLSQFEKKKKKVNDQEKNTNITIFHEKKKKVSVKEECVGDNNEINPLELDTEFNEINNRNSFQQALNEWRKGDDEVSLKKKKNKLKDASLEKYDEEANKNYFQDAVMEWRKNNQKKDSSTTSLTAMENQNNNDEYDEKENRRLFQEAVMNWRRSNKIDTSTQVVNSNQKGNLLDGEYNEKESRKSFQEALMKWRDENVPKKVNLFQGSFQLNVTKQNVDVEKKEPPKSLQVFTENVRKVCYYLYFNFLFSAL